MEKYLLLNSYPKTYGQRTVKKRTDTKKKKTETE